MSEVSYLAQDKQDEKAVAKVLKNMANLLTKDEQVSYVALQIGVTPDAVILTDKRAIFYRPKLFSMSFEDFMWRQVENFHVKEHMLHARITCKTTSGESTFIEYIPKAQARRVYAFAQEMEEKAYQARHQTDLEKLRAGAGGVVVQVPSQGSLDTDSSDTTDDPLKTLGQLKQMLDTQLITLEDYDKKKSELLSRL